MNLYSRHGLDFRLHPHQPAAPGGGPGIGPASRDLQFRRAGVPLDHIHRDVGVSGRTLHPRPTVCRVQQLVHKARFLDLHRIHPVFPFHFRLRFFTVPTSSR